MNETASPSPDEVASAVFGVALLEAGRHGIDAELVVGIWNNSRFERDDRGLALADDVLGSALGALDGAESGSVPVGWSVGLAHQLYESRSERRSRGAFYTPLVLTRGLVAQALARIEHPACGLRVCDPMCGGGAFLVSVGEHLLDRGVSPADVGGTLFGFDIDPVAVMTARMAVALWLCSVGGDPEASTVEVHDMLHGQDPPATRTNFGVIVGNPPFLGQLRSRSSRTSEQRDSLGGARGYADAAFVALERSLDWVGDGGRVVLIQPQSLLAARDARSVRDRIISEAGLVGLWIGKGGLFDAAVQVCAPIIDTGIARTGVVARYGGADVAPIGSSVFSTWPELLADTQGVPTLDMPGVNVASVAKRGRTAKPGSVVDGGQRVGDLALVTADFRQWFYDVADHVVEADDIEDPVPIMTSGLIDPMMSLWGRRTARIGGARWDAPSVSELIARGSMQASDRLVPKLLVANQTRCVEVVVDEPGRCLGITPVITVVPSDPHDIWRLAAVLCSPLATVFAHRRSAGSGLSTGAIRMTATLIAAVRLPLGSADAWEQAAGVLAGADEIDLNDEVAIRAAVVHASELMQRAFDLTDRDDIFDWWLANLPAPRGVRP